MDCSLSDITVGTSTATACEGAIGGNDANTISSVSSYFGLTGWTEIAKVDASEGSDTRLGLSVAEGNDDKSGTWSVSLWSSALTDIMIALKGGPTFSLYRFAPALGTAGTWSTDGILKGNGKPGPGLSHFTVYGTNQGGTPTGGGNGGGGGVPSVAPVPLPAAGWMILAALGGLLGLGRGQNRSRSR